MPDQQKTISYPNDIIDDRLGYMKYQAVGEHDSKITSIVNLHMPADISDSNSFQWETAEGTTGRIDAMAQEFAAEGGTGNVGQVIGVHKFANNRFVSSALSALGSSAEDATKAFLHNKRVGVNPFQYQAFQGIEFRTFSFAHRLIAKNEDETRDINEILYTFQKHGTPTMTKHKAFFNYPSKWKISFLRPDSKDHNLFLPSIHDCVLSSIETNYTGSGTWSAHRNGAPVNIEISLSFQETVLRDGDVLQGEIKRRKSDKRKIWR